MFILGYSSGVVYAEETKYINTDTTYRFFPNKYCKEFSIDIGSKVKVTGNKVHEFVECLVKNEVVWINKKYISKEKPFCEYDVYDGRKSFMSWQAITDTTSPQWKLQNYNSYTGYNGIRMVGDRYCIAVGSFFATEIGTRIDLVINNNGKKNTVKCILSDQKNNIHTDSCNMYGVDGSLAEFVVDVGYIPYRAMEMGDVSYASEDLSGNIEKIIVYKEKQ